jgi:hypothetical protein
MVVVLKQAKTVIIAQGKKGILGGISQRDLMESIVQAGRLIKQSVDSSRNALYVEDYTLLVK